MKPEDGQWIDDRTPPPVVAAYLENLTSVTDDRMTDLDFAETHDLDARTLRRWKKDPRFRKLWAEAADESVLGPEALSTVYESALKIIKQPDHPQWSQASNMILKLADKIRPPMMQIQISPAERFQGLSDEELAKLLAVEADGELVEGASTPLELDA